MAKAYVEFSTQQAVYQAALKAGSQIIQTSLLDFLR
jgi:flagellin-like hook-associated protein FlgL